MVFQRLIATWMVLSMLTCLGGCQKMAEERRAMNLRIGQGVHDLVIRMRCQCCEISPQRPESESGG